MTPQEQQLLQGLTDRVNQTQLTDKDPDAEQFIFANLGRNTDSLYILAQTVLVQQYALEQARKQLDQAKLDLDHARQVAQQQPAKHTSFLANLLGQNDPEPAHPAPPPPPQYAPAQNYPPPQAYAQPQVYSQPMGGGFFGGGIGPSGGGGFLRSAMQTATGVAAGALAFEGIESLMHGFGQHAGYGSGFDGGMGGGGFGQGREEVINNNYYGDSGQTGEHTHGDLSDRLAADGDTPSSDIEDRRDDSASHFADTSSAEDSSSDNSVDDSADNVADDSGSFDSGSDDSSSFDSGGSDDSSF